MKNHWTLSKNSGSPTLLPGVAPVILPSPTAGSEVVLPELGELWKPAAVPLEGSLDWTGAQWNPTLSSKSSSDLRTVREYISVVLSQPFCATLLQQL